MFHCFCGGEISLKKYTVNVWNKIITTNEGRYDGNYSNLNVSIKFYRFSTFGEILSEMKVYVVDITFENCQQFWKTTVKLRQRKKIR